MEEKKKMPVYVGKNVAVYITEDSSGDMGAFVAQEVTIEPKQAVEGLDALGSDTIEEWAAGLKTYEGTIKEPLMKSEKTEKLSSKECQPCRKTSWNMRCS